MLTYNATAVPLDMPEQLTAGHVLSVHAQHLNISLPEGVFTLQTRGTPLVPFGIEVDTGNSWHDLALSHGDTVAIRDGSLIVGNAVMIEGLHNCGRHGSRTVIAPPADPRQAWDKLLLIKHICQGTLKEGSIMAYLDDRLPFDDCYSDRLPGCSLKTKLDRCLNRLIMGLTLDRDVLLMEGVNGFLGLGPGLTPSGDDFLVGFLCGISHLASEKWQTSIARLAYCLVHNAPLQTTALSAEYIRYAANGLYHPYLIALLQAVCYEGTDETTATAATVLSLGHHSGADLLTGFVFGGLTAIYLSRGENNENL